MRVHHCLSLSAYQYCQCVPGTPLTMHGRQPPSKGHPHATIDRIPKKHLTKASRPIGLHVLSIEVQYRTIRIRIVVMPRALLFWSLQRSRPSVLRDIICVYMHRRIRYGKLGRRPQAPGIMLLNCATTAFMHNRLYTMVPYPGLFHVRDSRRLLQPCAPYLDLSRLVLVPSDL